MSQGGRHHRRRVRVRSSLIFAVAGALLGCGSGDPPVIDLGPTGEPSVDFASPEGEAPICVSIGDDANGRVPLVVAIDQIVLKPPGTCGTFVQCGHLVLYAEGVENNRSAVRGIDLLLGKLADPVFDGSIHDGTGEPDLLDLRVEVVTDAEEPLLDREGEPVAAELSLITVPDCAVFASPVDE